MMLSPQAAQLASWSIAGAATVGVIARPFDWPEAVWALSGAALLVLLGLLPWSLAWSAVRKGGDIYLFLVGMMLLSETARRQGLFDWVAVRAVNLARRSPRRLFLVVYAAGVLVTAFMSNDRDRRGADAGGVRRGTQGQGGTAALPLHLRARGQCGELRTADLEPGQHRAVRRPHAGAAALAEELCTALGPVDRRDLPRVALHRRPPPAGRMRERPAGAATVARRGVRQWSGWR